MVSGTVFKAEVAETLLMEMFKQRPYTDMYAHNNLAWKHVD